MHNISKSFQLKNSYRPLLKHIRSSIVFNHTLSACLWPRHSPASSGIRQKAHVTAAKLKQATVAESKGKCCKKSTALHGQLGTDWVCPWKEEQLQRGEEGVGMLTECRSMAGKPKWEDKRKHRTANWKARTERQAARAEQATPNHQLQDRWERERKKEREKWGRRK